MATNNTTVSIDKNGTSTGEAIAIDAAERTSIKARPGVRYLLAGQGETGPENATLTRSGSDLHLTLEGQASAALVLEGFFALHEPSGLYGLAEDGRLYAYGRTDGGGIDTLANGQAAPIALAGSAVAPSAAMAVAAVEAPPVPEPVAAPEPLVQAEAVALVESPPPSPPSPPPSPLFKDDGGAFWPLLLGGGLAAIGIAGVSGDKGTANSFVFAAEPRSGTPPLPALDRLLMAAEKELDLGALPDAPADPDATGALPMAVALAGTQAEAADAALQSVTQLSLLPASSELLLDEPLAIAIL